LVNLFEFELTAALSSYLLDGFISHRIKNCYL